MAAQAYCRKGGRLTGAPALSSSSTPRETFQMQTVPIGGARASNRIVRGVFRRREGGGAAKVIPNEGNITQKST